MLTHDGQSLIIEPGGFFLACENFWETVGPFTARLRFFLSKWRLARAH